MIDARIRPVFSTLTLCVSAAFFAYATPVQADVFEMGSDGKWQQISESPYAPLGPSIGDGEMASGQVRLPPVKLSAITSLGDQVAVQSVVLPDHVPTGGRYAPIIDAAAKQYGISPSLVDAVMWQESRYNPKAVSSAGAIGLMQLMPDTARHLGVNPYDPWQNVFGGAAYLRRQLDRFNNNVPFALAAYNAGPEAVAKHGGIPPYAETRNYVRTITRRLINQHSER